MNGSLNGNLIEEFLHFAFSKPLLGKRGKKWQATHIAPLNRLSLLYSYPGEFQQELVVRDLPRQK
jgi:hypothetical protein